MYTIDKEYLKALKKRLNGEREVVMNDVAVDERGEEKNDACACCLERVIRNVQNIISDLTLLELAEETENEEEK